MEVDVIICCLAVATVIWWIFCRPSTGNIGEKKVASILRKLPKDKYTTINNLLVNNNGHTSQIDHIVISEYGIFVIETKNYKGTVYGSEHCEYWTQNIYGRKYRLRNPVLQNYGHIKALKNILNKYSDIPYISIIAFPGKTQLRISSDVPVIYWHELIPFILRFKNRVITKKQTQSISGHLLSSNIGSRKARKQHIKDIQANIRKRQQIIASGKCPRCGGILIRRQGQYGSFYGCQNYPGCKFTINS